MATNDRQRYRQLVERFERRQVEHPWLHALYKLGFILLGYATLREGVVLTLGLLVGVAMVFATPPEADGAKFYGGLAVIAIIARAGYHIWKSRLEAPGGLRVDARAMPHLHKAIREAKKQVGGPRVSSIRLDERITASMYARPWGGLFGPMEHHLILGVPLMAALSPDQLRAVLAHEFSHMVGRGNHLNAWLTRVHHRWNRAYQLGPHICPHAMWKWYLMRLGALVVATSRASEFLADQASAKFAGTRVTGDALLRGFVLDEYAGRKYWPAVFEQTRDLVTPPSNTFSKLVDQIRAGKPDDYAPEALNRLLRHITFFDDSHPSLADRLKALDWPDSAHPATTRNDILANYPAQPQETAYDALITPRIADQAVSMLDQSWLMYTAPQWNYRHSEIQDSRRELERGPDVDETSPDDLMHLAHLHLDVHGFDAARPHLQRVLAQDAKHGPANLAMGQELLRQDDPAGAEYLQRVADHAPALAEHACRVLYGYYRDQADEGQAERCAELADEKAAALAKAQLEAMSLARKGTPPLAPHRLARRDIDRLREDMLHHPAVSRLYVAKIEVKTMPELEYYLIAVERDVPWYRFRLETQDKKIINEVAQSLRMPHPFVVYSLAEAPGIRRTLQRLGNALVYESPE